MAKVGIKDLPASVQIAMDWLLEKTKDTDRLKAYMKMLEAGDFVVLDSLRNLLLRAGFKKRAPKDLFQLANKDMKAFMKKRWVIREAKYYYSKYYDRDDVWGGWDDL